GAGPSAAVAGRSALGSSRRAVPGRALRAAVAPWPCGGPLRPPRRPRSRGSGQRWPLVPVDLVVRLLQQPAAHRSARAVAVAAEGHVLGARGAAVWTFPRPS